VKLGLRFDKVALAFADDVRGTGDVVPRGRVLIVTIAAPIRMHAKTSRALGERIRESLANAGVDLPIDDSIYGNRVCVCLAKNARGYASNVIPIVHNPETPAALLIEMTAAFLRRRGAEPPAGLERVLG
jgi:hypothetical protein